MGFKIFFSYSTADVDIFKIKELAKFLSSFAGIDTVHYWPDDITDNLIKDMKEALSEFDIILLFSSPNAIRSKRVEIEWITADSLKKPIVPIFFNTFNIHHQLRSRYLKNRVGIRYDPFNVEGTARKIQTLLEKKFSQESRRIYRKRIKVGGIICLVLILIIALIIIF